MARIARVFSHFCWRDMLLMGHWMAIAILCIWLSENYQTITDFSKNDLPDTQPRDFDFSVCVSRARQQHNKRTRRLSIEYSMHMYISWFPVTCGATGYELEIYVELEQPGAGLDSYLGGLATVCEETCCSYGTFDNSRIPLYVTFRETIISKYYWHSITTYRYTTPKFRLFNVFLQSCMKRLSIDRLQLGYAQFPTNSARDLECWIGSP